MNRPANAKRPVLFYFEHSRPFQYLSRLHLEWELIVLKFLLSLFHLATVNWEFEASSHKVIVLLFLFIFTFRHFLAPRRNDLISYRFKTGFYSLFCFDFSVFCFCCCHELILDTLSSFYFIGNLSYCVSRSFEVPWADFAVSQKYLVWP